MQGSFYSQSIQEHGSIRLRGVAALFPNNSFQFTQTHAVVVGKGLMRLGIERVALLKGCPERSIAHDNRVDNAKIVEGKLVLAQHYKFLRPRDGAGGRLQFTR